MSVDAVLATAREFARNELRPVALEYDETEEYPEEIVEKAAALGLTCYDLPAEHGGGGIDSLLDNVLVLEELNWGDSPISMCIAQGGFFAAPILAMGTAEQCERWVAPLCGPRPAC